MEGTTEPGNVAPEGVSGARRRSWPRRLRRIYLAGCLALAFLWMAGNAAQDAGWPLDLLSYLPEAPIAGLLLGAALLTTGRGRLAALFASATLAVMVAGEMRWAKGPAEAVEGPVYRFVHWNVFRDFLSWDAKIERLRHLEADVYVLNEVPRHVSRGETALRFGPGFTYALDGSTAIGCRGTVLSRDYVIFGEASALQAECEIDGRRLRLVAVDLPASPLEPRRPLIEKLYADIAAQEPDLVAGDFNMPRRAGLLRRPPPGYRHAYGNVGSGWPYTWPMPFPFLAIDQCLTGPRVLPISLRYIGTLSSDHRLQVLEFALH